MKIALIALAVLFVVGVGGCVAFAWHSLGVAEEVIAAELQRDPVFVEHVGQIQSFEFEFSRGFVVVGSNASGVVAGARAKNGATVWTVDLDNGQTFEVRTGEPREQDLLETPDLAPETTESTGSSDSTVCESAPESEGAPNTEGASGVDVTPSDDSASPPIGG